MPHLVEEHQIDMLEYYIKRLYSPKSKELRLTLAAERLAKFEGIGDNDLRKLPSSLNTQNGAVINLDFYGESL